MIQKRKEGHALVKSPIEPKRKFIEIRLKVLARHPMIRSQEKAFGQGNHLSAGAAGREAGGGRRGGDGGDDGICVPG